MIILNLKKSILNRRMLLAIVLSTGLLLFELVYMEKFYIYDFSGKGILNTMMGVYGLSQYVIFAGMFPGLPYANTYIDESLSGYGQSILYRMSYGKYIGCKILYTGMSGALVMVIPFIILLILVKLGMSGGVTEQYVYPESWMWADMAITRGEGLVLIMKMILLFLFGIFWSEVSLMIAIIVKNKYISFVFSFVCFELLWLSNLVYYLNPVFMIRSDFDSGFPIVIPYIVFVIYIIATIIGIWFLFMREMKR